ncbi:hypothetical protein Hte_012379 [Hypoxylon texense]
MPLSSRITEFMSCLHRIMCLKPFARQVQIRDETADISHASASVCCIVTLAMRDVVNAQAGASTTAAVAQVTAGRISDHLTTKHDLSCRYRRRPERPELWRFEEIINSLVRKANTEALVFVNHVGRDATILSGDARREATRTAIENAEVDVVYAVAHVVMAHIDMVQPTIASVWFIERLTSAVTAAASQEARKIADAATSNDTPPTYTPSNQEP